MHKKKVEVSSYLYWRKEKPLYADNVKTFRMTVNEMQVGFQPTPPKCSQLR